MKINGLKSKPALGSLLRSVQTEEYRDFSCTAHMQAEDVFLDYRPKTDENYPNRPYLLLRGSCTKLTGNLPYDVSELDLDSENSSDIEILYEFSDEELSDLCSKGLFNKDFKVPDKFYSLDYTMDVNCDFEAFQTTNEKGENIPIIIYHINDSISREYSQNDFGESFAEYFESINKPVHRQVSVQEQVENVPDYVIENELQADENEMVADEKAENLYEDVQEQIYEEEPEETLEESDEDNYVLDANKGFAESQRYYEPEEDKESHEENHEEFSDDYNNNDFETLDDVVPEDDSEMEM